MSFLSGFEKNAISAKAYVRALLGRHRRLAFIEERLGKSYKLTGKFDKGPLSRGVTRASNVARSREAAMKRVEEHHPNVRALEIKDRRMHTKPWHKMKGLK